MQETDYGFSNDKRGIGRVPTVELGVGQINRIFKRMARQARNEASAA